MRGRGGAGGGEVEREEEDLARRGGRSPEEACHRRRRRRWGAPFVIGLRRQREMGSSHLSKLFGCHFVQRGLSWGSTKL